MATRKTTSTKKPAAKKASSTEIETTVWIYAQSAGDGSIIPRFFNEQSHAQDYASHDHKRIPDDIFSHRLRISKKTGKILNPTPAL